MKKNKIIYWIATGLVAAAMLLSAVMYLTKSEELITKFTAIGIPVYLVTLLGVAKLIGGLVLIIPYLSRFKEWAYAGFTFVLVGAIWTHMATGTAWVAPFLFLIVLSISYWHFNKLKQGV